MGTVLQATDYLPFGKSNTYEVTTKRIKFKKGGYTNKYLFANKQLDPEPDLQYFEKRYYDNRIGRFTTEDPVYWEVGRTKRPGQYFISPQSWNSYSYVINNPINLVDPTGECWFGNESSSCIDTYKDEVEKYKNADSFIQNFIGNLADQNIVPVLDAGKKASEGSLGGIAQTGLNIASISPVGKLAGTFSKSLATVLQSDKVLKHMGQAKHGLSTISSDIKVVADKIGQSIQKSSNSLQNGSNQILTTINNQLVTIRVEIQNGTVRNVNAFVGDATRKIGNFINKTNK